MVTAVHIPPATARDALRTARTIAVTLPEVLWNLGMQRLLPAPSTATEQGLPEARDFAERCLRRLGVSVEVLHAGRVIRDGGVALMWNQTSHLDHLLPVVAIPRPFASLYNNAVASAPLYGEYMRATGHFHVDDRDEAQWRASVAAAAQHVQNGGCILVSPEGTRSHDGALLPFKRGAFLLAIQSRRPIQCVTIIGAHARLPRNACVVRPGLVRVVFSQPIPTEGYEPENRSALECSVAETFKEAMAEFGIE